MQSVILFTSLSVILICFINSRWKQSLVAAGDSNGALKVWHGIQLCTIQYTVFTIQYTPYIVLYIYKLKPAKFAGYYI